MKSAHRPLLVLGLLLCWQPAAEGGVLQGRVLGPGAQPLNDVDLDVFDQVTGKKLNTPNDNTSFDGTFELVVPQGLYRLGIDPLGIPGPTLAPHQVLDVVVTTTTDLGDITLAPGATVSGRVLGPGQAPVGGVDLDLVDTGTGLKAYTPGDNTNADGEFSFAVAAGTYMVQVEPSVTTGLLALEAGPFAISGTTALGDFVVVPGLRVDGRVTAPGGGAVPGIDADAFHGTTGAPIPLTDGRTDADGRYAVIVPLGPLDLQLEPHAVQPFALTTIEDVDVAAPTVVDVTLDLAAFDPLPTPIGLRGLFKGTFAAQPEVDEATVQAVSGAWLTLALRCKPPSALAGVALRAPSGAILPVDGLRKEKKGRVLVKSLPLPETGAYAILLYSRTGSAAEYTLRTRPKVPKELRRHTLLGNVAVAEDAVEVPFNAFAGSLLTAIVKAVPGGGLDPAIVDLRAPSGGSVPLDEFLSSVPGRVTRAKKVPLDEQGEYTLTLGGLAGSTGDFSALLKIKPPKFPKAVVLED